MYFFRPLLFLLVFAVFPSTQAQETSTGLNPETIMVGPFIFTRPATWQWTDTTTGKNPMMQSVTFQVNHPENKKCTVFINHFLPNRPIAKPRIVAPRWRESFLNIPDSVDFGPPVKIGTNSVVYMEITGTMKPLDPKKRAPQQPNFTLSGAVIPHREGNIILRLIGPKLLVTKTRRDFKRMIEDALKQE